MRAFRTSMLALVATAALGGCGGGSGSDSSVATAGKASVAPKDRFVARADAICAKANRAEAALGAPGPGWMYSEQFDDPKFLADFSAIGVAALRELEALRPSPKNAARARMMLASIKKMATALEQRTADLRAGRDRRAAEQIRSYEAGYSDLAVAAGPLGISECQGLML